MNYSNNIEIVKNSIDLDEENIFKNMNTIQKKNGVSLTTDTKNFSIEMET
jgi:restriction endonuclease